MDDTTSPLQNPNTTRKLLIGFILLIAVMIAYLIYVFVLFRITGTDPRANNVATLTPVFTVSFNKAISEKQLAVSGTKGLVKYYKADGNHLDIYLNHPLQANKSYTITLNVVHSTNGQSITGKTYTFKAKDVPYDDLSTNQKNALFQEQDKNQGASADPIMQHLPYGTLDFKLSGVISGNTPQNSKLTLNAQLLLSNADMSDEQAAVSQYKQEVIDYIKSLGLDPAKYDIQYTVVTPTE